MNRNRGMIPIPAKSMILPIDRRSRIAEHILPTTSSHA